MTPFAQVAEAPLLGPQALDDALHGVCGEAARDRASQGLQLTRAGVLMAVVQQRIDRIGSAQSGRNLTEARSGDAVRHQPQTIGIGPADGPPRERQIHADLVRHAGEGPADAVVREEADAGLGHGKAVALAGDAVRAIERDADAGADHHPVDERHGGLGEALEQPIERIFRRQGLDRLCLAAPAPLGGLLDVAAGAKGPVGGGGDHDRINLGIAAPAWDGTGDGRTHGGGQRIERSRPVQRDQADGAIRANADIAIRASRRLVATSSIGRTRVFHPFFFHRLFPLLALNFWILTTVTISSYI